MEIESSIIERAIAEHLVVIEDLRGQRPIIERIAGEMTRTLFSGEKILWCGNGGSAADAQHLAAELVGRFRRERRGLASIALTTDASILTSVANDNGYQKVFSRQVEALGVKGDMLIGISTSGSSRNVSLALETARSLGIFTVAFTGEVGSGSIAETADLALCVPSKDTARIQEAHILCGHMLCDWVEMSVCQGQAIERETTTR
ncbi:MAG: SIS domain-containing protein [Candidatus Sulfotelmatobacter sp.]